MSEIFNEIEKQKAFVEKYISSKADPDNFTRQNGDLLSYALTELAGYYTYLGYNLAKRSRVIADTRNDIQSKYANHFISSRKEGSTLEYAKQAGTTLVAEDKKKLAELRGDYEEILAWKKSISKYIDIVRSQLSYEKSLANIE